MWCVHSYAACLSRKWHATLICHLPSSFSVSLSPLPLFLIGKGTWSEDIHPSCRISAGLWLLWVPWCHRWYREIERERNMYVCVRGYIYVQCTYLYERQAAGCLRVYGSSESLDAPIIARDREREKYVCVRVWIYIFTMWIHIRMTSHLISSGSWLLWVPWCHRLYREIERERNMYMCACEYIYTHCEYIHEWQAAGCLRVYASSGSLDAYIHHSYGVATVSRIDKTTGLFCRISSLL